MINLPVDIIAFRTMFPELARADMALIRVQWNLAAHYAARYASNLPPMTNSAFVCLVAHLVKLNLMAQMGTKINGREDPMLQPPADQAQFKGWLQQTSGGRAIG